MNQRTFPVIDLAATGSNIARLRKERGLSVRDLQEYFGFEEPQAIYKWQWGKSLPSVDNLYALGILLEVPMEKILVPVAMHKTIAAPGDLASSAAAIVISYGIFLQAGA
ncbi:MAG: helix-turn-helix domain-containing protein [Dorea sp.]|nr:helix-turn-helix domain-containing protein [Dorea sp.]